MKKTFFLIYLLITITNYSQEISIKKSEIFKDSKKNSYLAYSLNDNKGGLVTIRAFYGGMLRKLKGYYIQHFDENLKLINNTEFEVDKNVIKNAFIKDDKLHLIEYNHDKKNNKISFSALTSSLDNFNFDRNEFLSISEENQKKYFGFSIGPFFLNNLSQIDRNHTGEIVMSENKDFFVINFDIKNKEVETHKVFVYDKNFNKIYDNLIQKKVKDKYFDYEDIVVDNSDGTVYFLGKYFENKSRRLKKDGKSNYHFEVFKVNANGQHNVSLKFENKSIPSLELIKTKNHIACVGFYGNEKDFKINGTCLFKLNKDNLKKEYKKFTPFSEEFLTDKYGNKESKKNRKKKKGIKNIDFKGIYLMPNEDIVINAEEFYITTHTYTDANGNTSTRTVYHYDDIISVRLDKDGAQKWSRNINKKQTGTANTSYTSISVNNISYFFINCSDRIKKLSADRISFRDTKSDKSNLYVIAINESGTVNFKKLIDDKESKVYYKVDNGIINKENNTVILIGKKKKKTRILKLKV